MTDSFLRQRRNLFIVNGILLFSYYAKVNIAKLTLAGISFSGFGKPEAIYYFLWIVFVYFLYRFTLFFIEDELSNFSLKWTSLMSSKVDSELKTLAEQHSGQSLNENTISGYYMLKKNDWVLRYQKELDERNPLGHRMSTDEELAVSRLQVLLPQLKVVFRFCFLTSALTNYLLPLALSLYVFIAAGLSSWEGAFVNILSN
ncbi:hypothetical protein [Thalassotalea euphylliae]|uniref:Uncharacterized protein n=1 Tax=Thalassotalea euphylliae TaxID=1655234 RepID=A0A3E0U2Q8_9GAMM|nr:hypothetical protein [Thalassotalea euphylliae]REL31208.1 hypothetical protein DXX94_11055 [Thalassotalea euphylliae]